MGQPEELSTEARSTNDYTHVSYPISLLKRECIEQAFRWGKAANILRKAKVRALDRVGSMAMMVVTRYNLIRMRNLLRQPHEHEISVSRSGRNGLETKRKPKNQTEILRQRAAKPGMFGPAL